MGEPELHKTEQRVKLWLLVVSLATIVLLVAAAFQENYFAEWRRLRAQYAEILRERATDERGKAAAEQFEIRIVQNYIPTLGAVDRCITCHAGVEDPRMVDQPQPFTTHPGRYLESHDPEKFGCTVCHQGQGRATEIADAHGDTPHWEHPLLPGRLAVAACPTCHADADLYGDGKYLARAGGDDARMAASDPLLYGRELVRQEGCLGCHVIDGKGGRLGADLTYVGAKTRHGFDFTHMGKDEPRTVTNWLMKHFIDPASVSPGTLMPATRHGEAGAAALTAYMLSLRRPAPGGYARHDGRGDRLPETGSDLYAAYCSSCHGEDGRESNVPGVRTPALNNPDVLGVAGDDYYRLIIAKGRSRSQMPPWGEGHGNLSREEIDRIVAHIREWEPVGARVDEISSRSGDFRKGRAYYDGLCAGCHGLNGEGGIGNALASATFLAIADDRFLAGSIIGGRPGTAMPAWKQLPRQAISDLLAYIRTWQPEPPTFEEVVASMAEVPAVENARIGRSLYKGNCQICHGERGVGDIGPSLTSSEFLGVVDDAYLHRAITEGRPATAMPAWQHLSAADVGALIAYLRSFHQQGPLKITARIPAGDYAVGEVHYRTSCSGCHGQRGGGGVGPQLANRVFLSSASDQMLFHWIANGRAGTAMKGFLSERQGPVQLTAEQIADVIAYLRHVGTSGDVPLSRAGVGNPRIGRQLFAGQCAACHGPAGEGASGPQLNNPAFLRTASDGFLTATLILGRSGTAMPRMIHGEAGVGQLPSENIQDIVAYVRLWESPDPWRKTRRITDMSPRAVTLGGGYYGRYCAGCHGPSGRGERDGPGYYAPALNNPEFLEAASDGFLLATIARGRSRTPMRPFGRGAGGIVSLDPRDIDEIVSFIRSWQGQAASNRGGSSNEEM